MITTGSKLLIGSAVVAAVAAILYGVTQDGVLGTVGLSFAAAALAFLAGVNLYVRDANVLETDPASVASSAAAAERPGSSPWPFLLGGAAIAVTVGLVTSQAVVTVGIVLLLAAGAEWVVLAWAERTSSDPGHNAEVRVRTLGPLEFPLFAAIAVGILVYSFSRVMLSLAQENTVILFFVVATIVVLLGFLVAFRPSIRSGAIGGILAVASVAIVASGVVLAGLIGHLGVGQATLRNGVISGLFVWTGFVATTLAVNYLNHGIGWKTALVDGAYWLAALILMGAVIGALGAS